MNNLESLKNLLREEKERGELLDSIVTSAQTVVEHEYIMLVSSILGLATIQLKNSKATGKKAIGLKNLIEKLKKLDSQSFLFQIRFCNGEWAGYFVLSQNKSQMLGYAVFPREKKQIPTPPGWDGSLEMLEDWKKTNDKNKSD